MEKSCIELCIFKAWLKYEPINFKVFTWCSDKSCWQTCYCWLWISLSQTPCLGVKSIKKFWKNQSSIVMFYMRIWITYTEKNNERVLLRKVFAFMYLDVRAPVSLYAAKRNEENGLVSEDIKEAFSCSPMAARNFVTDIFLDKKRRSSLQLSPGFVFPVWFSKYFMCKTSCALLLMLNLQTFFFCTCPQNVTFFNVERMSLTIPCFSQSFGRWVCKRELQWIQKTKL